MNRQSKNLNVMFLNGYRPEDSCEWVDVYNKTVLRGGHLVNALTCQHQLHILIEVK